MKKLIVSFIFLISSYSLYSMAVLPRKLTGFSCEQQKISARTWIMTLEKLGESHLLEVLRGKNPASKDEIDFLSSWRLVDDEGRVFSWVHKILNERQ